MNYNYRHIGALVGQLNVLRLDAINDGMCAPDYNNATSYYLSKVSGLSRYHVVNILEIALTMGLVERRAKKHRSNAVKHCYFVTLKGIDYVSRLKDEGLYVDCLTLITSYHYLNNKDVKNVDYVVSVFESALEIARKDKK